MRVGSGVDFGFPAGELSDSYSAYGFLDHVQQPSGRPRSLTLSISRESTSVKRRRSVAQWHVVWEVDRGTKARLGGRIHLLLVIIVMHSLDYVSEARVGLGASKRKKGTRRVPFRAGRSDFVSSGCDRLRRSHRPRHRWSAPSPR